MGFWSKLGKLGLAVAPYVAAPFTGGASLMFAPATDAALGQWNRKDAEKRAAQGLGPSKFDKWLGIGSGVASIGSSLGAFSGLGALRGAGYVGKSVGDVAKATTLASRGGSIGGTLGNITRGMNVGQQALGLAGEAGLFSGGDSSGDDGGYSYGEESASKDGGKRSAAYTPRQSRTSSTGIGPSNDPRRGMNEFNEQAYYNLGPVMGNMNQNNPNLAESIAAGRMQAQADRARYFGFGYDSRGRRVSYKSKGKAKTTAKATTKAKTVAKKAKAPKGPLTLNQRKKAYAKSQHKQYFGGASAAEMRGY